MEAYPTAKSGRNGAAAGCEAAHVSTGARLHFGFLDPSGRGLRPFGSFGLALDWPRTSLALRRADAFAVEGPERERALSYLCRFAEAWGARRAYALRIEEAIPPHSGLGSGTQLALAIGSAVAALEGRPLDLSAIAALAERGKRSGIGIGTFAEGGVVLDGGPGAATLPPILARLPFPSPWRVLLIFHKEAAGLSGAGETAAFAALAAFPQEKTAELCRRVLMDALPALAEQNFPRFAAAVGALQAEMGAYYASLQGGAYVSPRVGRALGWLAGLGIAGLGQSSWGPTGFAFVATEEQGRALLDDARARVEFASLAFHLVRGRNEGATIETR
jgi:beta-ribofuranosylaminobenzene 5'-phosphate synthase